MSSVQISRLNVFRLFANLCFVLKVFFRVTAKVRLLSEVVALAVLSLIHILKHIICSYVP